MESAVDVGICLINCDVIYSILFSTKLYLSSVIPHDDFWRFARNDAGSLLKTRIKKLQLP